MRKSQIWKSNMLELLDVSDNEINTSTRENQQGTTENDNENENGNSRHIHTIVLMKNVKNLQK